MSLFLLPIAIGFILVAGLVLIGFALGRAIRSAVRIAHAQFQVTPETLRPGEGMRVWARVVPRGSSQVFVRATLHCTMFDHRARHLYEHAHNLTPVFGKTNEFAAYVQVPAYALRSGVVGNELSNLFSEDAHRLLVFWSVDLEVRLGSEANAVLMRQSVSIEVPEGRPLQADRDYMDQIIVQTCGAMQSDLVFNWLVRLASADGVIDPGEQELLRHVLASAFGVTDPEAADRRIRVELQRDLQLDARMLRRHLPPEQRLSFYRFLFAMAWRDGSLDGREHNFLMDALEKFGLDRADIAQVEREVLRGMAAHAIH